MSIIIGYENLLNKAVEYPSEVISVSSSASPWIQGPVKSMKYIPGRILSLVSTGGTSISCSVILFETRAIKTIEINDLHFVPEIKTNDGSYVISGENKYYIKDNFLHRDDGPAIEGLNTGHDDKYYLNGIKYTAEDYLDQLPEEKQTNMLFHLDKMRKIQ